MSISFSSQLVYALSVLFSNLMNILIVHASPEPKSFGSAMKDLAVETLSAQGHKVVVSDLYQSNFDPVASAADVTERMDPAYLNYMLEQRNASENDLFAADIKAEIAKVKEADFIIFNFPVWWFGAPAILKGWIDRVFALGETWSFGGIYDQGLLRGKRGMLSVTTGGPAELYKEDGAHGATLDQILFPITHGALYFCGVEVLPTFVAWSTFQAGDEGRKQYLADFQARLETIEHEAPMAKHRFDS